MDRGARLRTAHRRHARPPYPSLSHHRDQGRELPAPRRQGPDVTSRQIRHRTCGRNSKIQLTSTNRSAAVFGHHALPFWIIFHNPRTTDLTHLTPVAQLTPTRSVDPWSGPTVIS